MAGGSVKLESLPEYAEFDSAYRMAEALMTLGAGFENGSENGNQNLLSQMNAWTEVLRLIDVLLAKDILPAEKAMLEGIKAELQKKIEPISYKVSMRGIVRKNNTPIDPNSIRVPTEMPAGVPETSAEIQAAIKKVILTIMLPPGKTKEEQKRAVRDAQQNFTSIFLTDWTNTKGRIAGKWKIPFTQQKEYLEYFKTTFENNLKGDIFRRIPDTDFRKSALTTLYLAARLKFLQASGGRRKTIRRRRNKGGKGGKGKKSRRASKLT
jgi:hypothetical protein